MCLYSFVVPVFNVKNHFLEQCIDSILANDCENMEIILVDDCSTSGCEALCDEYAAKDKRISVFHQRTHVGVSKARNIGISRSAGAWIVFVDSDDWIDSKTCQRLSAAISDDTDIILYSAYRASVNQSRPFGASEKNMKYARAEGSNVGENDIDIKELSDNLLTQSLKASAPRYETIKYCWGKAFRRDFIVSNEISFPDINYCEDILYMADAFRKANQVVQIPDRLYHYRVSESSAVNSYHENALTEQKAFLAALNERTNHNDTLYYGALLSMQICITRHLYHKGRKSNLLKRHLEARTYFSQWPYSEVFQRVDCKAMKRSEKIKATLIKHKLYFLYYLGTEASKMKSVRFQ